MKGLSLCFRSHQMLIVLLRSRHGFRTVPGDVRELLDLGKLVSIAVRHGWRTGIRLQLRRIGGRAVGLAPGLPGSDALSDDVAVAGGSEARADAEQGVEGRCGVAAAVPAEHELVEIAVQMGAAQAMEGSERPALRVREHTMDPDQHEMGGRCTDDLGLVVVVGQARITAPPSVITRARAPRSWATKVMRLRRNPMMGGRDARGRPWGDSSKASAISRLPARPCPSTGGADP